MNAAIATHLNILESAIVRVEEWSKVLFVVAKGIGARFVSKKVVKVEQPKLDSTKRAFEKYENMLEDYGIEHARKELKRFADKGQKQLNQSASVSGLTAKNRNDMRHDIELINKFLGAE